MKTFILFLIAALLAGCGSTPFFTDPRNYKGVDPEFQEYAEDFQDLSGLSYINIPINFLILEYNKLGVCHQYSLGTKTYKEIFINVNSWDALPEIRKRFLIYHELTHCAGNVFTHVEGDRSDGCALSVMNEVLPSKTCLQDHEVDYLMDLF